MTLRRAFFVTLVLVVCGSSARVDALDIDLFAPGEGDEERAGPTLSIHGFASQGFILSTKNDYIAKETTKGSFQFTELGLNLTVQLLDDLRFGAQAFVQDVGPTGNFLLRADWFHMDYRFRNWLGFRAGRMKIPMGLYNEYNDIDAGRNSILMPQSVYPLQSRQLLYAQNGFELYGFKRFTGFGALNYQAYGGRIYISENDLRPLNASFRMSINVPWVTGGRVIWETPVDGLRLAGSFEAVRLNATVFVPTGDLWVKNRSYLGGASVEYVRDATRISAEYVRTDANQQSNEPVSDATDPKSDRMYVQVVHGVTEWLQAGAYYSLLFDDTKKRREMANTQHDLSGTLRFDVNQYLIFKAEGHLMRGVAGLNGPVRIGQPVASAEKTWSVFLLKATTYF